jgi:hypothetical protein
MKNLNQIILKVKDIKLTYVVQCPSACVYRRYSCRAIHNIETESKSCAQLSRLLFPLDVGDGNSFTKCTSVPEMRGSTISSIWVLKCLVLRKLLFVKQSI